MKIVNLKLKTKLVLIGILITFIPLIIILSTVYNQNRHLVHIAETASLKLAFADLDHIVDNLYTLAESHQEVTQKNINSALNVARYIKNKAGGISISNERHGWEAINQYTKASQQVSLPKMQIGNQWLGQISSPGRTTPLVDEVQKLVDVTCTVFQRMNSAGDMLRVATNVIKTDGKRAIGTFIPAANPNGDPNPVVSAVLQGKTFRGRAFVVNKWYITAYEPIYGPDNKIVGVLYVGIPQENVKSLRKAIMDMSIGKGGYVTVLDSSGKYVFSKKGKQDGDNVLNLKDETGKEYIKERIQTAETLAAREIGHLQFSLKDQRTDTFRTRDTRFVHFKPWDWIITAESDEAEFTEVAGQLAALGDKSIFTILTVGSISLVIIGFVWVFVSGGMVKFINHAVLRLKEIAQGDLTKRLEIQSGDELGELAREVNVFLDKQQKILGQITESSSQLDKSSETLSEIAAVVATGSGEAAQRAENVAVSAEEMSANMNNVAAASEQASANVQMVAAAAEQMSATISKIAGNTEKGRTVTDNAVTQANQVSARVAKLGKAANEVGKVTETINEISEQTNLLALNATIEAARAGEAGKGFAVVANEIKDLAKQTADATKDIRFKIEGIQSYSESTVSEIGQIQKVINDINEIVETIATAVEEQSTSTKEIAGNVNQAAQGIQDVNANVAQSSTVSASIANDVVAVNQSSSEIANGSGKVNTSANELSKLSEQLQSMVNQFKL